MLEKYADLVFSGVAQSEERFPVSLYPTRLYDCFKNMSIWLDEIPTTSVLYPIRIGDMFGGSVMGADIPISIPTIPLVLIF